MAPTILAIDLRMADLERLVDRTRHGPLTEDEHATLKAAIDDGTLSVSKARRITRVITQANSSEWIAKAVTMKQPELERAVGYLGARLGLRSLKR